MNLKETFKNDVSSGSFKIVDSEKRLVGKWGQISIIDDVFDIWLIKPDLTPLTERKLTVIQKILPDNPPLIRLTGEAYFQTKNEELVRKCIPFLGIRKRKQQSLETIRKNTKRLANLREARI